MPATIVVRQVPGDAAYLQPLRSTSKPRPKPKPKSRPSTTRRGRDMGGYGRTCRFQPPTIIMANSVDGPGLLTGSRLGPSPGYTRPSVNKPPTFSTVTVIVSVTPTSETSFLSAETSTPVPAGSTRGTTLPSPMVPMTSAPTTPHPSVESSAAAAATSSGSSANISGNGTLVITLSTVLSVVGLLLVAGSILVCCRYRQKRLPFFRGISPIDDDEIETWKVSPEERDEEKQRFAFSKETGILGASPPDAVAAAGPSGESPSGHAKKASTATVSSSRKAPGAVIVYQTGGCSSHQQLTRRSEELSPRSLASSTTGGGRYGRMSLDKDLPQTPILARAPNAREGLTDESIPGDEPYIPVPKRQPSRISKMPPPPSPSTSGMIMPSTPPQAATRARSSTRSSTRSFGDNPYYSYYTPNYSYNNSSSPFGAASYGSDQELHRSSSDYPMGSGSPHASRHRQQHQNHSRMYSSSSIPPRLSFGDQGPGGLSPRPLLRDEIGRAIG